ncbi:cysteine proteinase [Trifolium pratense]|uniref:Cysteine proteinase n=2 Tax=Trifolium pratense TaxID=57577 RepID=A0A2K3LCJ8_TRIPR|nr:cysteine proteinase [Trifolium pratense]
MMMFQMTKLFVSFFILIFITCLSFALPNDQLNKFSSSDEQVFQLFKLWQIEHGREYGTTKEKEKRLEIFKSNLKYINEMNAKRKSPLQHRLSLNKFADMSPEEFSKTYLQEIEMQIPSKFDDRKHEDNDNDTENLPASVDWREKGAVTDVRDQGDCQSHWAFSVTGAIEGLNKIVTGNLINLSAQELVDCDHASNGCAGGYYFNAFGWVINNGGIDTEANYPYIAKNGTCKVNANKVVSIGNLYVLDGTEEAFLDRVSKQPVSVSLDATGLQFYAGGVYGGEYCTKDSRFATLVALIVGYDSVDGEDYWIVKNSWGKDWGEKGYLYIKRNVIKEWPYGVCAINAAGGYPITTVLSSSI